MLINNQHYVLIKEFNKLMFDQTKSNCKKNFCMHYLQCFGLEDVLTKHIANCMPLFLPTPIVSCLAFQ